MRGPRDIAAAFAGEGLDEALLAGAPSPAQLVHRVVERLAAAMGADRAALAVPTDDGRHLLLTSAGAGPGDTSTLPLADPFPAAQAIRAGEALYLPDPDPTPGAEGGPADRAGARGATACLPLPTGPGIGGALLLHFSEPAAFSEGERTALSAVAREVGKALERARLLEAASTARTRLVLLAEASARFLETGPDRAALLAAAAACVAEACGDPCLVHVATPPAEASPSTRLHDPDPASRTALAAHPEAAVALAEALLAEVVRAGDTLFRPVLEAGDPVYASPAVRQWLERFPAHGLLAAPLRVGGTPFGVVAVLRRRPHAPYTMDDRLLLEGLADRAAVSIGYQRLAASERAAGRRQAQLAEAARAFSEVQGDLGEVQRTVARRGAEALSARFTVWSCGADGRSLEPLAAHPFSRRQSPPGPLELELEAAREAARTGQPLRRGRGGECAPADRHVLAVPLWVEERICGALTASRRPSRRGFSADEERLLGDLAVHAALALGHARKRTELEAERARLSEVLASAEDASRAKDEFLAMLSHELRNPLSPIVTALELMRLHAPAAATRERVVIERQVAHLVRMVDDLLDVSRVIRGKVRLERRVVPLAEVVARAVEQASPLLEERRHSLVMEVAEEVELDGDAHRLAQVLANLLTNAAKYTDPGGRIVLRAMPAGAEVRLSVTDTGIGISPALLPRVFDLFVQGERNLDRAPGGLGIGLTIVRSLVDLHGGRVAVESSGRGRGSTFTVWLPMAAPGQAGRAARSQVLPAVAAPGSGVRVLVVDDNEDAAELLAEALRARGHDVRVAFDGPTALVAAEEVPPRVALLDIGLPVMDGFELARRLRGLLGPVGLVAVTGYGQEPDRRASAEAGFDAHLVKPVDLDHICGVVERLVGGGPEAAADAVLH